MALPTMLQTQSQDDQNDQNNDSEKSRKRNEFQRSIIILESDYKKRVGEKTQIDADMRALKKDEEMARVNQRVKQEDLNKLNQDLMILENEIKSLRKKLNLL